MTSSCLQLLTSASSTTHLIFLHLSRKVSLCLNHRSRNKVCLKKIKRKRRCLNLMMEIFQICSSKNNHNPFKIPSLPHNKFSPQKASKYHQLIIKIRKNSFQISAQHQRINTITGKVANVRTRNKNLSM